MDTKTTPQQKPSYDVERLIQALQSFAGVAAKSADPTMRVAAHQLRENLKQAKVKT